MTGGIMGTMAGMANLPAKRQLSPYEQTHLARYGFSHININEYGEVPVEYITGKIEFAGYVFDITQDTLIPRIESEELVGLAISELNEIQVDREEIVVAEVGTGCGAIGISLYWEWYESVGPHHPLIKPLTLYLSDISAAALGVARQNVNNLIKDTARVHVLESDLLSNYPSEAKFDLIVANLPYIPTDRIKVLDASVKDFEPYIALDGGEDGLKYIRELIVQADKKLNEKGVIILEIDYTHDLSFLKQQLPLNNFNLQLQVREDSFHRTRFAILNKKSLFQ